MDVLCAVVASGLVIMLIDFMSPDPEVASPTDPRTEMPIPNEPEGTQGTGGPFTDGDPTPSASPPSGGELRDIEVHVNEDAGYLFSYPAPWQIEREGSIDRLVDPTGGTSMTFDVASPGSLRDASDRTLDQVVAGYTDVEFVARSFERTAQGLTTLTVGGRGVAPDETTARFLVITIHTAQGNWAITIRFSPEADPSAALPAIREVLSSFRISSPS